MGATEARKRGEPEALPNRVEEPPAELAGQVAEQYRRALVDADRLDTPDGAIAMSLAIRLDNSSNSETGSSYAALAKQAAAQLERALDGALIASDPLDELARRRVARRRA